MGRFALMGAVMAMAFLGRGGADYSPPLPTNAPPSQAAAEQTDYFLPLSAAGAAGAAGESCVWQGTTTAFVTVVPVINVVSTVDVAPVVNVVSTVSVVSTTTVVSLDPYTVTLPASTVVSLDPYTVTLPASTVQTTETVYLDLAPTPPTFNSNSGLTAYNSGTSNVGNFAYASASNTWAQNLPLGTSSCSAESSLTAYSSGTSNVGNSAYASASNTWAQNLPLGTSSCSTESSLTSLDPVWATIVTATICNTLTFIGANGQPTTTLEDDVVKAAVTIPLAILTANPQGGEIATVITPTFYHTYTLTCSDGSLTTTVVSAADIVPITVSPPCSTSSALTTLAATPLLPFPPLVASAGPTIYSPDATAPLATATLTATPVSYLTPTTGVPGADSNGAAVPGVSTLVPNVYSQATGGNLAPGAQSNALSFLPSSSLVAPAGPFGLSQGPAQQVATITLTVAPVWYPTPAGIPGANSNGAAVPGVGTLMPSVYSQAAEGSSTPGAQSNALPLSPSSPLVVPAGPFGLSQGPAQQVATVTLTAAPALNPTSLAGTSSANLNSLASSGVGALTPSMHSQAPPGIYIPGGQSPGLGQQPTQPYQTGQAGPVAGPTLGSAPDSAVPPSAYQSENPTTTTTLLNTFVQTQTVFVVPTTIPQAYSSVISQFVTTVTVTNDPSAASTPLPTPYALLSSPSVGPFGLRPSVLTVTQTVQAPNGVIPGGFVQPSPYDTNSGRSNNGLPLPTGPNFAIPVSVVTVTQSDQPGLTATSGLAPQASSAQPTTVIVTRTVAPSSTGVVEPSNSFGSQVAPGLPAAYDPFVNPGGPATLAGLSGVPPNLPGSLSAFASLAPPAITVTQTVPAQQAAPSTSPLGASLLPSPFATPQAFGTATGTQAVPAQQATSSTLPLGASLLPSPFATPQAFGTATGTQTVPAQQATSSALPLDVSLLPFPFSTQQTLGTATSTSCTTSGSAASVPSRLITATITEIVSNAVTTQTFFFQILSTVTGEAGNTAEANASSAVQGSTSSIVQGSTSNVVQGSTSSIVQGFTSSIVKVFTSSVAETSPAIQADVPSAVASNSQRTLTFLVPVGSTEAPTPVKLRRAFGFGDGAGGKQISSAPSPWANSTSLTNRTPLNTVVQETSASTTASPTVVTLWPTSQSGSAVSVTLFPSSSVAAISSDLAISPTSDLHLGPRSSSTSSLAYSTSSLVQPTSTTLPTEPHFLQPVTPVCSTGGVIGNWTLDFELEYDVLYNPYLWWFFSTYWSIRLPLNSPYQPFSGQKLAQFTPPTTGADLAEINVGPGKAQECYAFNFYGLALGCGSTNPGATCDFTFAGYAYNGTTKALDSVQSISISIPSCPAQTNCPLTPITVYGFTHLTTLWIQLTVQDQLSVPFWVDDIKFGWSDNSCGAATCRRGTPVPSDSKAGKRGTGLSLTRLNRIRSLHNRPLM